MMQVEVGPNQVQQIFGIALVHDGEALAQPEGLPMDAQEPVGDGMKGSSPNARGRCLADDLAGAADHFAGGAARKRQQENARGRRASANEGSDARR